jgi:hypothetical protein
MPADVVGVGVGYDSAIASPARIDEDFGPDPVNSILEIEHERSIAEPWRADDAVELTLASTGCRRGENLTRRAD